VNKLTNAPYWDFVNSFPKKSFGQGVIGGGRGWMDY